MTAINTIITDTVAHEIGGGAVRDYEEAIKTVAGKLEEREYLLVERAVENAVMRFDVSQEIVESFLQDVGFLSRPKPEPELTVTPAPDGVSYMINEEITVTEASDETAPNPDSPEGRLSRLEAVVGSLAGSVEDLVKGLSQRAL